MKTRGLKIIFYPSDRQSSVLYLGAAIAARKRKKKKSSIRGPDEIAPQLPLEKTQTRRFDLHGFDDDVEACPPGLQTQSSQTPPLSDWAKVEGPSHRRVKDISLAMLLFACSVPSTCAPF